MAIQMECLCLCPHWLSGNRVYFLFRYGWGIFDQSCGVDGIVEFVKKKDSLLSSCSSFLLWLLHLSGGSGKIAFCDNYAIQELK